MNPSKWNKEQKVFCQFVIHSVLKNLQKKEPKIVKIDSNVIHFIIYDIQKKLKPNSKDWQIPFGWFIHGLYSPLIDDMLVEMKVMDKKYHQLDGEEPFKREFSDIVYVKGED